MRKPLGKNEIKRVARIWLASFTAFYVRDFSEGMEGALTDNELIDIYAEIERMGDRMIGIDVHRSNLHEVVQDVLDDRK